MRVLIQQLIQKNRVCMQPSQSQQLRQTEQKKHNSGLWTNKEHKAYLKALAKYGKDWAQISVDVKTRSKRQVRSHHQKVQKRDEQRKEQEDRQIFQDRTRKQKKENDELRANQPPIALRAQQPHIQQSTAKQFNPYILQGQQINQGQSHIRGIPSNKRPVLPKRKRGIPSKKRLPRLFRQMRLCRRLVKFGKRIYKRR